MQRVELLSPASKNRGAIVIRYFRDIGATVGISIAVLVCRDDDEVDMHIRQGWQPVLAYDKDADLEFLQSFVHEDLPKGKQDRLWLSKLLGAENSIRAEKLVPADPIYDPIFDQKLADALLGL